MTCSNSGHVPAVWQPAGSDCDVPSYSVWPVSSRITSVAPELPACLAVTVVPGWKVELISSPAGPRCCTPDDATCPSDA